MTILLEALARHPTCTAASLHAIAAHVSDDLRPLVAAHPAWDGPIETIEDDNALAAALAHPLLTDARRRELVDAATPEALTEYVGDTELAHSDVLRALAAPGTRRQVSTFACAHTLLARIGVPEADQLRAARKAVQHVLIRDAERGRAAHWAATHPEHLPELAELARRANAGMIARDLTVLEDAARLGQDPVGVFWTQRQAALPGEDPSRVTFWRLTHTGDADIAQRALQEHPVTGGVLAAIRRHPLLAGHPVRGQAGAAALRGGWTAVVVGLALDDMTAVNDVEELVATCLSRHDMPLPVSPAASWEVLDAAHTALRTWAGSNPVKITDARYLGLVAQLYTHPNLNDESRTQWADDPVPVPVPDPVSTRWDAHLAHLVGVARASLSDPHAGRALPMSTLGALETIGGSLRTATVTLLCAALGDASDADRVRTLLVLADVLHDSIGDLLTTATAVMA